MKLTDEQIKDNERYFHNVLSTLNEGGVFGWKDLGEVLVKRNGKFECNKKAYDKAKEITGKHFFEEFFILIK
jgi:hypothetical protein